MYLFWNDEEIKNPLLIDLYFRKIEQGIDEDPAKWDALPFSLIKDKTFKEALILARDVCKPSANFVQIWQFTLADNLVRIGPEGFEYYDQLSDEIYTFFSDLKDEFDELMTNLEENDSKFQMDLEGLDDQYTYLKVIAYIFEGKTLKEAAQYTAKLMDMKVKNAIAEIKNKYDLPEYIIPDLISEMYDFIQEYCEL